MSQTTGKVTFINDPEKELVVKVKKVYPDAKSDEYVGQLFTDPAGRKLQVEATLGDRFDFEVDGYDRVQIKEYLVKSFDQTYQIEIKIPLNGAVGNFKMVPNSKASTYSYNIFKVVPEDIDRLQSEEGGAVAQIFEGLDEFDTDWHIDANYAIKNQFNLISNNEGSGTSETVTTYGKQQFEESFSFNILGSIGIPGVGSLSRSLGIDTSSSITRTNKDIVSFARDDQNIYHINLIKEKADLHKKFIEAVKNNLPTPDPNTLDELEKLYNHITDGGILWETRKESLKRINELCGEVYTDFINKWGTHYPEKVTYGGFLVAYKVYTMEQVLEADSFGISYEEKVSAEIKGVELGREMGFNYDKEETFTEMNSSHRTGYMFKGGSGKPGQWEVDQDNIQPTKIKLERLHELLIPETFRKSVSNDELSDKVLADKQNMLKYALTAYIGSSADKGNSLVPKVYYAIPKEIKNTGEDTLKLYGNVVLGLLKKEKDSQTQVPIVKLGNITIPLNGLGMDGELLEQKSIFSRTDKGGSFVSISKGQSHRDFNVFHTITKIVDPQEEGVTEDGDIDVEKYSFMVFGALNDRYDNATDAKIGIKARAQNFKNLGKKSHESAFSVSLENAETNYHQKLNIIVDMYVKGLHDFKHSK